MNKYQEALDELHLMANMYKIRTNPLSTNVLTSYFQLQELVDKEEKYRWHDLRKNADDLPNYGEYVLTYDGENYNVLKLKVHYFSCYWESARRLPYGFKDVVKWRYIEVDENDE